MRRKSNGVRLLTALIAVVVVTLVTAFLLMRGLFVVRSVQVTGVEASELDTVVRQSGIRFGASIGSVRASDVRDSLEASGTYALDGLEIRRPSTVILNVRHRTRDAIVLDGGVYLVLDADGVVIDVVSDAGESEGILVIGLGASTYKLGSRVTAQENRLAAMKTILDTLNACGGKELFREIDLTDLTGITLTTTNLIVVKLGSVDKAPDKLLWAVSAVRDTLSRGEQGGTLDVSSASGADYRPLGA